MIDYPNCGENNPVFEQDEPVAVVTGVYGGRFIVEPTNSSMVLPVNMALYARPQPRKPLADEAIATVYWGATGQSLRPQDNVLAHKFARAIEAAHGIKE